MPIHIDPSRTFSICLPADKDKPEQEQRRIRCKVMTARETLAFRDAYEAADKLRHDREYVQATLGALAIAGATLEGAWSGAIDEAMSIADMVELCEHLPTEQMVSEFDRKKSARQSPSSMAVSAAAAAE